MNAVQPEKASRINVARTARSAERLARFEQEVLTRENGLTVRELTPDDIAQLDAARARRREHPEAAR